MRLRNRVQISIILSIIIVIITIYAVTQFSSQEANEYSMKSLRFFKREPLSDQSVPETFTESVATVPVTTAPTQVPSQAPTSDPTTTLPPTQPDTVPSTSTLSTTTVGVITTTEWSSVNITPTYMYPEPRTNFTIDVTIIVIVMKGTPMERYATARNSVECYAALHGYHLAVFYDDKYKECQIHKDVFFRRHCNVHLYMKEFVKEGSYVLFIDGDVGVINPNHYIEDWIQPEYDIYLFDRFWNWEYTALYLVKNNDIGRGWVNGYATFEFSLPKSHHGTDNGALHPYMMSILVPESKNPETRPRMAEHCLSIWNRSKSWDNVFEMESCVRSVIGERQFYPEHRIRIYPKGKGWFRDLWLLSSHWSYTDFMVHAVKEQNLKPYPTDEKQRKACHNAVVNGYGANVCGCVFPVLEKLNIEECKKGKQGWLLEERLRIDDDLKWQALNRMANRIMANQIRTGGKTADKVLNQ